MTGWNEDNFIERVVPLLGRRFGAVPCPEAAAFLAASDGDTSGVLKKAMAEHASRCTDCRDLQQRIERFDAPMVTGHDAEWKQTEKRLDNWMESFLASDAAVDHERDRIRASRLRLFFTRLTGPSVFRQLRWALVPAVTLALVIGSFWAGRVSVRRAPQVTAEVQRLPVTIIPPRTVVEQSASEKEPTGKSQGPETAQIPPKPAEGGTIASSAPRGIGPSAASPTAPHGGARPTDTAVLALPAPSNPEKTPITSPPEPMQVAPRESAPNSPSVRSERAVEAAETSAAAPSIASARPGVLPSSRATPSGLRSIVASRGVANVPEAKKEHPPAGPAPPLIRLDAGTRVWITLKSIHPRADGVSEFRGLVLLPVTQSGATLLGRNTEVSGTMTVSNGKRSVQIREFLSAGARYRLRGASGEANLHLLGAGEVVQFDAGRVLETWMAVVSTYEKQPGESKPPE
jgi:hypothetical protein